MFTSVKCICFMLRHLMPSWNLKISNSKIWFSQEQKELLKWKNIFFLVWQVLSFRLKKQTSKNLANKPLKFARVFFRVISYSLLSFFLSLITFLSESCAHLRHQYQTKVLVLGFTLQVLIGTAKSITDKNSVTKSW